MSLSCIRRWKCAFISTITETNRKLVLVTPTNLLSKLYWPHWWRIICVAIYIYCNKWRKGMPFVAMHSLRQFATADWYYPNHLLSYTCDWKSLSVGYMPAQVSHYHLAHESHCKPLPQGHPGANKLTHPHHSTNTDREVWPYSNAAMNNETLNKQCMFSVSISTFEEKIYPGKPTLCIRFVVIQTLAIRLIN